VLRNLKEAEAKQNAYREAQDALAKRRQNEVQAGRLGVDLSVHSQNLRGQSRLDLTAQRNVGGRVVTEVGGVWIDEGFTDKMKVVTVKAQSDAYFRLLEKKPQMKDVLLLGNYVVWVTPSNTALVIDTTDGVEKITDAEIDALFQAAK
jgi:Ca-activated chloride channel family protein